MQACKHGDGWAIFQSTYKELFNDNTLSIECRFIAMARIHVEFRI